MQLTLEQSKAIERAKAKKLSYAVRIVRSPNGNLVVILGETHVKFKKASEIGKDIVSSFELRGVETVQRNQVVCGRILGFLITNLYSLYRLLSFGALKGSTITDAKNLPSGYTVELERTQHVPIGLHVAVIYLTFFFIMGFLGLLLLVTSYIAPIVNNTFIAKAFILIVTPLNLHVYALIPAILLRRYHWSWLLHPLIGILTLRDELMAAGTIRMLKEHPEQKCSVVIMGRAHVRGVERLLVEQYGFTRLET